MLHGKQLATGSTPTNRLNLGGSEGKMVRFDSNQLIESSALISATPTALTVDGDMVVSNANLDVNGSVVQLNTETISFGDTMVEINSDGAAGDIGFSINRGDDDDVRFYYDQAGDVWKMDTIVAGELVTRNVLLEDVMIAADDALTTAVGNETTRAADARLVISTALSAAIASRIANDNQLTSMAASQLSTINGWISDANTRISDEESRALDMEQDIRSALTGQSAAAIASEGTLSGLVSAQNSEAEGEEEDLSAAIAAASLSATTAENALSGDTLAQTAAAQSAEGTLDGIVTTEITRQEGVEDGLQTATHNALVSYLEEEIRHDAELSALETYIAGKISDLRGSGQMTYDSSNGGSFAAATAAAQKNYGTFHSQLWNGFQNVEKFHQFYASKGVDQVVTQKKSHVVETGAASGTYTITIGDGAWDAHSEPKVSINGLRISDDSYTWTWEQDTSYYPRPGAQGYYTQSISTRQLKTIVIDIAALGYAIDVDDIITTSYNVSLSSGVDDVSLGMQAGELACTDTAYVGADTTAEVNVPSMCTDYFYFADATGLNLNIVNDYSSYGMNYCIIGVNITRQSDGVSVFSKAFADFDQSGVNAAAPGSDTYDLSALAPGVYTMVIDYGDSTSYSMGAETQANLTGNDGVGGTVIYVGRTDNFVSQYTKAVSGQRAIVPFTILA